MFSRRIFDRDPEQGKNEIQVHHLGGSRAVEVYISV